MPSDENEVPLERKERKQEAEKPVKNKDIANLYSQLQTMIENVPKTSRTNSNDSKSSDSWHPSFPLTPTTSSSFKNTNIPESLATNNKAPKEPDCPCHHILVSKDSKHCALCDDTIPIIAELHQDRDRRTTKIKEIEHALKSEKSKSKGFENDVVILTKKSEDLTKKLKYSTQQHESLRNDIAVLKNKCENEVVEAEKAKQEKANLESELEDLSQKLFEEANGMVADEKKQKHKIEIQYKHLEKELESVRQQMEAEELQLKELRLKMENMEENHKRSGFNVMSDGFTANNEEVASQQSGSSDDACFESPTLKASRDLAELFTHDQRSTHNNNVDPAIFDEFEDFVKLGGSIPVRKIHSMPYVKTSLEYDIEPCLKFGPNSRLSSKKLYEAILLNTCFIEETPYGYAQEQAKRPYDMPLRISAEKSMIWERLSSTPTDPFTGCQACGRNLNLENLPYRFRISMVDDWACIDRYCRDRLVAVCEFYSFIRNVRQGYYNGRTASDLFQESIRLKIQMFYARMGLLCQKMQNMGIKGDVIGQASEPNMVIPPLLTNNDTEGEVESVPKQEDIITSGSNPSSPPGPVKKGGSPVAL